MNTEMKWITSASCGHDACVQVGRIEDSIAIRDSKNPDRGHQLYTAEEWLEFVAGVKRGDFDSLLQA